MNWRVSSGVGGGGVPLEIGRSSFVFTVRSANAEAPLARGRTSLISASHVTSRYPAAGGGMAIAVETTTEYCALASSRVTVALTGIGVDSQTMLSINALRGRAWPEDTG